MIKNLICLLFVFVFAASANAQLDKFKKKSEEKAKQMAEKEIDKKKSEGKKQEQPVENSKSNPTSTETGKQNGNQSSTQGTSTSSMPPANNPPKNNVPVKTKLSYRTANAIFPKDDFYKNNVGKVLFLEASKRENDNRSTQERVKTEMPVNGAMSFYVALPTTPHDFPVYPNGDTLKDGFEISNSNVKLIFKVKNSPLSFTFYNEYPIKLGDVRVEIPMHDFYGSNVVGDQRDYALYNDLKDSIPNFKYEKWRLFLESLPLGKNEIEVTAWISYVNSMDEAFYPVSVANGEFIIYKSNDNSNIDYNSRFRMAVLNRRYREALSAQVVDEGITSSIHKENVGKIIFSKSPILKGQENPSLITNSFSGSDLIYGRLYLDKTISNLISRDKSDTLRYIVGENLVAKIYIDGKEIDDKGSDLRDTQDDIYGWMCNFPDDVKENRTFTTHEVAISPDRSSALMNDYHPILPYFLNTLSPGTHIIRIEAIGALTGTIFATGEFNYTKVAGTVLKYGYDLSKIACSKKQTNSALEGQIKQAFLSDEKYNYYKANFSLVSVTICESEWTVHRNAFGTILKRGIDCDILIKDKFGNYKLLHSISAIQDYNGSAYGKMYLGSSTSDYYVVPGK